MKMPFTVSYFLKGALTLSCFSYELLSALSY